MTKLKRIIALVLAAATVLSLGSFALAKSNVTVTCPTTSATATNGAVSMQIRIANTTGAAVTVTDIQPTDTKVIVGVTSITKIQSCTDNNDGTFTISDGQTNAWLEVTATLATNAASGNVTPNVYLDGNTSDPSVTNSIKIVVPSSDSDSSTGGDESRSYVRVSPIDANGNAIPAASGNYGEKIHLRLPLVSDYMLINNLMVTPVITTDVETFPFELSQVDYTAKWPGYLQPGTIAEFTYDFVLSKKVTAGVKKVDFQVVFTDQYNNLRSGTVSLYVNVKRGASAGGGTSTGDVSTKLLIEPYIKPASDDGKVYAGEIFNVEFSIKNISSGTVKNVIMKLNDTTGVLLPANNGTNTLYVDKIAGEDAATLTVPMIASTDAEPKAYTLACSVTYDGAAAASEQNVTIPVAQRIRLKFDQPVIYDEGWVGSTCAMYLAMYNLGKSSVYNCMVSVEGEGLSIEETYFGGNVSAGGTMRADFNVIPSVAGDIAGEVVVTYEDASGAQYEERQPFTLYVNEEVVYDPEAVDPGMDVPADSGNTGSGSGAKWLWLLTVPAAGAGGFFLIKGLKKRRQKELMDIEDSDV